MTSSKTERGGKFLYNILFNYLMYPFLNICTLAQMAMVNTQTILVEFSFVFIYSSLLRKISFNLSLFAENLKLNQYETRAIIVGDILNMNYSMQELMILRHSKTIKQKIIIYDLSLVLASVFTILLLLFYSQKKLCTKNELESNLTFHLNLAKTLGCFVKYDK